MEKSLEGLNPAQQEAVKHLHKNVMVFAGPGTGKTRVIMSRISYLFEGGFVPPSRKVLTITFTNKAAKELKERARKTGVSPSQLFIGTFHTFCVFVLRSYLDAITSKIRRDFTFVPRRQQLFLARSVIQENDLRMNLNAFLSGISNFKNSSINYNDYTKKLKGQVLEKAAVSYQRKLFAANMIDYDDAILLTITLFQKVPSILKLFHNAFPYVLIDEMQDTNKMQLELIKLIGGGAYNVMAVADDDQSIYAWRGALPTVISDYVRELNAEEIVLTHNYRSPQLILDAANSLMKDVVQRKPKQLTGRETTKDDCIELHAFNNSYAEGRWIAEKIKELHKEGIKYNEVLILYRNRHSSLSVIDEALKHQQIPFNHFGRNFNNLNNLFAEQIVDVMKLIIDPSNSIVLASLFEALQPTLQKRISLSEYLTRLNTNESELIKALSLMEPEDEDDEFLKRLANLILSGHCEKEYQILFQKIYDVLEIDSKIRQLDPIEQDEQNRHLNSLKEKIRTSQHRTITDIVAELDLHDDSSFFNETLDCVSISTLHTSKGLEYKVVFIVALEDDFIPGWNTGSQNKIDEERRTLYVGMTRSESKLYLTYSLNREGEEREKSRFLTDIPVEETFHESE